MAADGLLVGAVGVDPCALGQGRRVEVQGGADDVFPVQRPLGRLHGLGRGGLVDAAVAHRLKLDGVLPVENDALHCVRKLAALHPVQDHIAHGDLPGDGFPAAFGVDDPGQPVQLPGVIGRPRRGHRRAPQIGVPLHPAAQGLAHQPQGHIGHAPLHRHPARQSPAADGDGVRRRVRPKAGALGSCRRLAHAAVPPHVPIPQGSQQGPEGHVGHPLFHVGSRRDSLSIRLHRHAPAGGPGGDRQYCAQQQGGQQIGTSFHDFPSFPVLLPFCNFIVPEPPRWKQPSKSGSPGRHFPGAALQMGTLTFLPVGATIRAIKKSTQRSDFYAVFRPSPHSL